MARASRFPARAAGPGERLAGFMAHLRLNGIAAGPGETAEALRALAAVDAADPGQARAALRCLFARDSEGWAAFDRLFDAYWFNAGRARAETRPAPDRRRTDAPPALWRAALGAEAGESTGAGPERAGAADPGEEAEGSEGRLIATRAEAGERRDLRGLMDPATLSEAEAAARRLARAIRDRRSRRRRAAVRGSRPDMRRVIRRSLARGGEPIDLARTRRPERAMRIVALLDVSASMGPHARVFLAFLKGLLSADTTAEAWLFHTRLMRVTPALAERDPLRAATRLSLMAEGFGGGTDIAGCLESFAATHAARAVNRRTVVVILSDGYCTAPAEGIGQALARLRRRAGRILWLNPLADWRAHAPVARGIAAALPHLDAHRPVRSVADLAALEHDFARL